MTRQAPLRIDAHQHFWSIARADCAWLNPAQTPTLAPLCRDHQPADLQPLLGAHRVAGTVLVQAAPALAETHCLLALASRHAFIQGVLGWVDLAAAGAPAVLDPLAEHAVFKGVRPMLQDLADDA